MIDMTPDEIDQLLHESRIGRLSMAGDDRRPYTIPIPFCWADGAIYLRLPLTGRKGRILAENNRVCFEVDDFTDSFDQYASILIEGPIIPVTDLAEKMRIKQQNDEKYRRLRNGHRPGHGRSTPLADLPMRKITAEQLSGRKKDPIPSPPSDPNRRAEFIPPSPPHPSSPSPPTCRT